MAEIRPKNVAGIGLFLNQPLYWYFADFLRCGRWTIVSCLILRVPAINCETAPGPPR